MFSASDKLVEQLVTGDVPVNSRVKLLRELVTPLVRDPHDFRHSKLYQLFPQLLSAVFGLEGGKQSWIAEVATESEEKELVALFEAPGPLWSLMQHYASQDQYKIIFRLSAFSRFTQFLVSNGLYHFLPQPLRRKFPEQLQGAVDVDVKLNMLEFFLARFLMEARLAQDTVVRRTTQQHSFLAPPAHLFVGMRDAAAKPRERGRFVVRIFTNLFLSYLEALVPYEADVALSPTAETFIVLVCELWLAAHDCLAMSNLSTALDSSLAMSASAASALGASGLNASPGLKSVARGNYKAPLATLAEFVGDFVRRVMKRVALVMAASKGTVAEPPLAAQLLLRPLFGYLCSGFHRMQEVDPIDQICRCWRYVLAPWHVAELEFKSSTWRVSWLARVVPFYDHLGYCFLDMLRHRANFANTLQLQQASLALGVFAQDHMSELSTYARSFATNMTDLLRLRPPVTPHGLDVVRFYWEDLAKMKSFFVDGSLIAPDIDTALNKVRVKSGAVDELRQALKTVFADAFQARDFAALASRGSHTSRASSVERAAAGGARAVVPWSDGGLDEESRDRIIHGLAQCSKRDVRFVGFGNNRLRPVRTYESAACVRAMYWLENVVERRLGARVSLRPLADTRKWVQALVLSLLLLCLSLVFRSASRAGLRFLVAEVLPPVFLLAMGVFFVVVFVRSLASD